MMKYIVLPFLLLSCSTAANQCRKPVVIAVIDSGFGYRNKGHSAHLCKYGHKDFSIDRQFSKDYGTVDPVPLDYNDHGTNVVGIIDENTKNNFCIVIIKYFSDNAPPESNLFNSFKAIEYANNINADVINYSGGGPFTDVRERSAVSAYLDSGGIFIAAAGNYNENIDVNPFYPASYDSRIIVVGNNDPSGKRSKTSNYGSTVDRWEMGEKVSYEGITHTGTSQATAKATSKVVNDLACTHRKLHEH